jgi:HK97 family phage portal protein
MIKTAISRIKSWFSGSEIPSSWPINWWQRGWSAPSASWSDFSPIRACVSVISQELSRIPPDHIRLLPDGGQELITTSAAYRALRRPNDYQTRSDFFLNMTRWLLLDGNAYAYAKRNGRGEVASLWPLHPRTCRPYIEPESGSVFYQVGNDAWTQVGEIDANQFVPAREILHVRLETPNNPLVGESPLVAAELSATTGVAIQRNSAAFFANKAQPSGYLRVPGRIDPDNAARLQDAWQKAHGGERLGRIAILGGDAEYKPVTMTAVDAETVAQYRLTIEDVARIYRVPPFLLGNLENATLTNVEALTRFFVTSGLGWYVDHWEESLTRFFRMPEGEKVEFDVESALLRSDMESRMNAYSKGIQSGIYAPNEVRRRELLPPVPYGDEPRVQQQLVPLSFQAEPPAAPAPAPSPAADGDDVQRSADILYFRLKQAIQ